MGLAWLLYYEAVEFRQLGSLLNWHGGSSMVTCYCLVWNLGLDRGTGLGKYVWETGYRNHQGAYGGKHFTDLSYSQTSHHISNVYWTSYAV